MNRSFKTLLFAFVALLVISCGGGDKTATTESNRSVQYFPNMYESVGYETYQEGEIFNDNQEAQKPVEGSVSRGWLPYDYEDDNDGYASAKAELNNPLPYTEENLTNGQMLYGIYCAICHGKNGNGQGHLVKTEKILGVPSYDAREITQGSIYHVMYYGINSMGSYASQTSTEERWQIAHYVDALRRDLKGTPRKEFVKSGIVADPTLETVNDSTQTATSDKDSEMEMAPVQPQEIEEMKSDSTTDGQ